MHLLATTNIAAKANVGGTAEMDHLSNVVTGNLQCYTSQQGSMLDSFIKIGKSNIELCCFFMLVDDNLVPDGPNGQLDPYFIKLIVPSPSGSLGKDSKSFSTAIPDPWSICTERLEQSYKSGCFPTILPIVKYAHSGS